MKLAISNTHTKGKRLKADMLDKIDGKKLSTQPSRLVRKAKLSAKKVGKKPLVRKLESSRGDLTPEDAADAALVREHIEGPEMLVRVASTSGDLIYSPGTQSTRYSASHAIRSNLQRRIPGSTIKVNDIGGDGLVRLSLSIEYTVDDVHVELEAQALASSTDMTIVQAAITCNDKSFDIDPVDQSRTPEQTAVFLKRLAANCALGA